MRRRWGKAVRSRHRAAALAAALVALSGTGCGRGERSSKVTRAATAGSPATDQAAGALAHPGMAPLRAPFDTAPPPSFEALEAMDSLVLERWPGPWEGIARRLRVARSNAVALTWRSLSDSGHAVDTLRPNPDATKYQQWGPYAGLTDALLLADFFALPDRIEDVPAYCAGMVTDQPTAIVTTYLPGRVKRVEDYHGCLWGPAALRELEDRIDNVALTDRLKGAIARDTGRRRGR